MPGIVEVEGFSQLAKALTKTGPEVRRALKDNLKELAEPIATDAEHLALTEISHIGLKWWRMRREVTRSFSLVYVAPLQRGVKVRGPDPRRRPKFADLLAEKAMGPARERNADRVVTDAEKLIDQVTRRLWF